jgi:rhodanese-related sulfurtransferase
MLMEKRSLSILVLILIFVFSLYDFGFAEGKAPPPIPPIVKKMVVEAKTSVKSVDMEALKAAIDNKEDVAIIDVRVPMEYATGHVPGSINIPRGLLEFFVWGKVVGYPEKTDTSKTIYIYCKTGIRAALAVKSLQDLGLTNATLVDMKIAEWVKAGYPIKK